MNPSSDGKSLLTGSPAGKQAPAFRANFVESAFDAIVAFDSRGQIIFWNPAAERLFGWQASEALDKASAEFFGPIVAAQGQGVQNRGKPARGAADLFEAKISHAEKMDLPLKLALLFSVTRV